MTHAGSKRNTRVLRSALGLALGALLAAPAYACGPDFPMTLLDRRDAVMGLLPEGVFDFEATRLVPKPADALVPVEWSYWDETAELRAKAETEGLPAGAAEAIAAMRVLVASAPLVVVNAALWGVLAAHQKFRAANLVTMPVGIFYYLGPVLVLSVWNSLTGAMLALVACRLANTISYAVLVRPLLPG